MSLTNVVLALLLVVPAVLLYRRVRADTTTPHANTAENPQPEAKAAEEEKPKTIMQPAKTDLAPPKDDPFTLKQLKEFDGSDSSKPIYVAIKGAWRIIYFPKVCSTNGAVGL